MGDDSARGVVCGLSRGVKRAHLIRAAMESITYQIADVVEAMQQHDDFHLSALMVDGGPTKNDWLMQYQADLLGCPVMRSDVPELSAIGAGLLARKALIPGTVADLKALLTEHSEFKPDMARHQRLQKEMAGVASCGKQNIMETGIVNLTNKTNQRKENTGP